MIGTKYFYLSLYVAIEFRLYLHPTEYVFGLGEWRVVVEGLCELRREPEFETRDQAICLDLKS